MSGGSVVVVVVITEDVDNHLQLSGRALADIDGVGIRFQVNLGDSARLVALCDRHLVGDWVYAIAVAIYH